MIPISLLCISCSYPRSWQQQKFHDSVFGYSIWNIIRDVRLSNIDVRYQMLLMVRDDTYYFLCISIHDIFFLSCSFTNSKGHTKKLFVLFFYFFLSILVSSTSHWIRQDVQPQTGKLKSLTPGKHVFTNGLHLKDGSDAFLNKTNLNPKYRSNMFCENGLNITFQASIMCKLR